MNTHNENRVKKWTAEQLAIFAWFAGSLMADIKTLVIWALPGTGKTSTCVEGILNHAKENSILVLAFMSRNASDFRSKISDPRVKIETFNALGNQILNKRFKFVRIDATFTKWTEHNRIKKLFPELKEKRENIVRLCAQLVSAAKNSFIGVPSLEMLEKLVNTKGLLTSPKEQAAGFDTAKLASFAKAVMELSLVDSWRSFDDQIWQTLTLDLIRPEYPLVVVDEAQDLNPLNWEFAKRLVATNGRIATPGDNNQSMYTFRGAVPNGMQKFSDEMKAGKLTLTETFRVPKSGVAAVNYLLPDYIANGNNREGIFIPEMSVDTMTEEACIGAAILSRKNAPLMPFAFMFIRKGKPVRIEGKEIGKGLLDIMRTIDARDINEFNDKLGVWEQARIAKAGNGFNSTNIVDTVQDQAQTLRVLCEACDTLEAMETRIKSLFQDSDDKYAPPLPAIVLSTVHKAKGLEWETVYMLAETFNGKQPETEEAKEEEKHIQIVARTRHWNKLAIVQGQARPTVQPVKQSVTKN